MTIDRRQPRRRTRHRPARPGPAHLLPGTHRRLTTLRRGQPSTCTGRSEPSRPGPTFRQGRHLETADAIGPGRAESPVGGAHPADPSLEPGPAGAPGVPYRRRSTTSGWTWRIRPGCSWRVTGSGSTAAALRRGTTVAPGPASYRMVADPVHVASGRERPEWCVTWSRRPASRTTGNDSRHRIWGAESTGIVSIRAQDRGCVRRGSGRRRP